MKYNKFIYVLGFSLILVLSVNCLAEDNIYEVGLPYREKPVLIEFFKEGKTARLDIVDGKLVYSGDIEISESAKIFFEYFITYVEMMCEKLNKQGVELTWDPPKVLK